MKKVFGGFGKMLYLVKRYWKYGKAYMVGRIVIEILIARAVVLPNRAHTTS